MSKNVNDGCTYYAVCDANGPISVELGDSEGVAIEAFDALDKRAAIDAAKTDLEDALGISGEGMSESEFADALNETGSAEHVRSLELIHGHRDSAHLAGGWSLWRVYDAG